MARHKVEGVGGVFLRAKNPGELMKWYEKHLGINEEWPHGHNFLWKDDKATGEGMTVWSLFASDTDYFGERSQMVLVNYRVRDLDAFLAQLKAEGVNTLPKREESEYGRFAWIIDPEGNRIELWQPPG